MPGSLPASWGSGESVARVGGPCYASNMLTTQEKLDTLFAKLRSLPEERKALAVEALAEIIEELYVLSDHERMVLEPALAEAKRGENLIDADKLDLLNKPWA
jgi:hypothetical protein